MPSDTVGVLCRFPQNWRVIRFCLMFPAPPPTSKQSQARSQSEQRNARPMQTQIPPTPSENAGQAGRTISITIGNQIDRVGKIESSKVPFDMGGPPMIQSKRNKRCHPSPLVLRYFRRLVSYYAVEIVPFPSKKVSLLGSFFGGSGGGVLGGPRPLLVPLPAYRKTVCDAKSRSSWT